MSFPPPTQKTHSLSSLPAKKNETLDLPLPAALPPPKKQIPTHTPNNPPQSPPALTNGPNNTNAHADPHPQKAHNHPSREKTLAVNIIGAKEREWHQDDSDGEEDCVGGPGEPFAFFDKDGVHGGEICV